MAGNNSRVAITPFSTRVVVDGKVIPVNFVQLSYGLNQIPSANFGAVIGTAIEASGTENEGSALKAQTNMEALTQLTDNLPVQIYLNVLKDTIVEGKDAALKAIKLKANPNGYLIFDGYTVGFGDSQDYNSASINISALHKTFQFSTASMFLYPFTSAAAGAYRGNMKMAKSYNGNVVITTPGMVNKDGAPIYQGMEQDLWSLGLKLWFEAAGSASKADPLSLGGDCAGTFEENTKFLETLTSVQAEGLSFSGNLYGIINGIHSIAAADANVNAWSALLNMGANLGFAVIPDATKLRLRPHSFVASLTSDTINITPENIWSHNISGDTLRSIRGGFFIANLADDTLFKSFKPYPFCQMMSNKTTGFIETIAPPGWIAETLRSSKIRAWIGESSKPVATNEATTGVSASSGTEIETTDKEIKDNSTVSAEEGDLCRAWVKEAIYLKAFMGRMGQISGPLRFDISPGANVLVDIPLLVGNGKDTSTKQFVGCVSEVKFTINPNFASTSVILSYIRTKEEAAAYSVSEHFLFEGPLFRKGNLVEGIQA